jgi:peptidoglycan hydrolase CwlO-like protein
MKSGPEFRSMNLGPGRRLTMKITYMTAAQLLLLFAACLPAAAQAGVNPSSTQTSAGMKEAQVKTLQQQLDGYQQQVRAKAEQVENARQEAISAGIQGDGAGPFIDGYRQEQKELEALQAALTPKIEQTRTLIASLTTPAQPSITVQSPKVKPAGPVHEVVAANNSQKVH